MEGRKTAGYQHVAASGGLAELDYPCGQVGPALLRHVLVRRQLLVQLRLQRREKRFLGAAEGTPIKVKGRRMLDTPDPSTGLRS